MLELLNGVALACFALIGVGDTLAAPSELVFSSHIFIFATLIVVLAIRTMFAASIPAILYAGTVPMTVAVVARLLLLGNPFYFALATMAVGIYLYFLFLARGLRSTALSMLEYRAEKDALIAELEEQKSVSDEARRRAEAANTRQVTLPRHDEPRTAHAAQRHPRLFRGDEDGDVRARWTIRSTANTPATSTTAASICCTSSTRSST